MREDRINFGFNDHGVQSLVSDQTLYSAIAEFLCDEAYAAMITRYGLQEWRSVTPCLPTDVGFSHGCSYYYKCILTVTQQIYH